MACFLLGEVAQEYSDFSGLFRFHCKLYGLDLAWRTVNIDHHWAYGEFTRECRMVSYYDEVE
jgi:hypothetical protein